MCSNITIKVEAYGKEIRKITRICEYLGFEYIGDFFSPGGICGSLEYEGKVVQNNSHYYLAVPAKTKEWTELRELNWTVCKETWIERNECAACISLGNKQFAFKTIEELNAFLKANKAILDEIYVHYDKKTIPAENFEKWLE